MDWEKLLEKSAMRLRKSIKRTIFVTIALAACVLVLVFVADRRVSAFSRPYLSGDPSRLPRLHAGLVLGTAKTLSNGHPNPYFTHRIEAAAKLYHAGNIERIVVSGDNSTARYNEPQDMKDALVAAGVPPHVVSLDYAGFRTLDSVVRMDEIFSQSSFIVISQRFHNERAIYLARHKGMDVWGFDAQDVSPQMGLKTMAREKLARVKMFLDLWTHKQPKYLGKRVDIG